MLATNVDSDHTVQKQRLILVHDGHMSEHCFKFGVPTTFVILEK